MLFSFRTLEWCNFRVHIEKSFIIQGVYIAFFFYSLDHCSVAFGDREHQFNRGTKVQDRFELLSVG
jgi:hypothetical protein